MRLGCLGLFLLACFCATFGQEMGRGVPTIQNYTKHDYAAETQNWDIAEDRRGLMYFGNNLGLLEFDGTYWRIYPLPNRSILRSIAIAENGRMYVGGQDEVGYFEPAENGLLQYHSLLPKLPEDKRNIQDVWQTIIRDDGVYFGSYRYLFRLHEDAFSIWEIEGKLDGLFEANGNIYIAGKGKGIQILRNDKLSLLPGTEAFVNWEVRSILSAGRDSLLIATEENGAFIWSNNQISSLDSEVQAFLIENRIYCASQLSNGHYAIGTSHNGLLILDRSAKPLQTINKAYGLLNNSILSVHESKDGNLWLGLENGISFVELNSSFSYLNEHLGIEGTAYSARVHLGKLYLATNQGVYVKDWIGPPDPLAQVPFQQVSGTRGANWNLQNLGGELILGRHYGTARINGFQTKVISDIQGSWKISQLSQYPDFAIEGKYDGLCLYRRDGPSQTWRFVKQLAGFDESSRIFEEDKQGNIWVSHPYRGVFKVKIDPYKAEILSVQSFGAEDGLPSDLFINVCKINQEILFTTEKGVYYFDTQAERFRTHSAFNEVLGDSTQIYRLIEDESGNIWFSVPGEFGMLRIEDNTLQKQVQKLSFDLLQNRLVKGYEFVYAFDERNVFIGTDEGFILYNPLAKVGEGLPLPICLREVVINNGKDSLLYGGVFWENDALLSSQTQSQIKKIDPDFRSLRFSFAAPFFENLNELQYQYRLEGEDEQWSFWTAKTEKEYTNLKPGQYVFWVKARNIFGKESEPISYELIIKPHWYESNFAKSCYFLFALALLFGVVRYQSFRAQRQVEALKMNQAQALEQQEAEYKQEAQRTEAEIIRLRNEKLRGEVAHKNKELASTTMHLVQKGEILLKIKANLQKLAKNANPNNRKTVRDIIRTIDDDIRLDNNWEQFEHHFDQVHGKFLANLREKFPVLTAKDQRLAAYLRMNLSTKEIAQLMNISVRGVEISRYRLRKKLNLAREVNLNDFMMGL